MGSHSHCSVWKPLNTSCLNGSMILGVIFFKCFCFLKHITQTDLCISSWLFALVGIIWKRYYFLLLLTPIMIISQHPNLIVHQNTHSINCIPFLLRSSVPPPELLHAPSSAYISWNNGRILMFKVSKQPYQSSRHDEIICRWRHDPTGGENLN